LLDPWEGGNVTCNRLEAVSCGRFGD
jgi:hypothetical protein